MNNIFFELHSNSCKYPCLYGKCIKDNQMVKWSGENLSSIQSLTENQTSPTQETDSCGKKTKAIQILIIEY